MQHGNGVKSCCTSVCVMTSTPCTLNSSGWWPTRKQPRPATCSYAHLTNRAGGLGTKSTEACATKSAQSVCGGAVSRNSGSFWSDVWLGSEFIHVSLASQRLFCKARWPNEACRAALRRYGRWRSQGPQSPASPREECGRTSCAAACPRAPRRRGWMSISGMWSLPKNRKNTAFLLVLGSLPSARNWSIVRHGTRLKASSVRGWSNPASRWYPWPLQWWLLPRPAILTLCLHTSTTNSPTLSCGAALCFS
mmetsp:Transcript_117178/g.304054  ORF Transcript_117178/g.304054 Transcript_117178/m.304054 type:complete len:250 (+) Transcript_117178:593-1342(+)